jgi:hypothetical protein
MISMAANMLASSMKRACQHEVPTWSLWRPVYVHWLVTAVNEPIANSQLCALNTRSLCLKATDDMISEMVKLLEFDAIITSWGARLSSWATTFRFSSSRSGTHYRRQQSVCGLRTPKMMYLDNEPGVRYRLLKAVQCACPDVSGRLYAILLQCLDGVDSSHELLLLRVDEIDIFSLSQPLRPLAWHE